MKRDELTTHIFQNTVGNGTCFTEWLSTNPEQIQEWELIPWLNYLNTFTLSLWQNIFSTNFHIF